MLGKQSEKLDGMKPLPAFRIGSKWKPSPGISSCYLCPKPSGWLSCCHLAGSAICRVTAMAPLVLKVSWHPADLPGGFRTSEQPRLLDPECPRISRH